MEKKIDVSPNRNQLMIANVQANNLDTDLIEIIAE